MPVSFQHWGAARRRSLLEDEPEVSGVGAPARMDTPATGRGELDPSAPLVSGPVPRGTAVSLLPDRSTDDPVRAVGDKAKRPEPVMRQTIFTGLSVAMIPVKTALCDLTNDSPGTRKNMAQREPC